MWPWKVLIFGEIYLLSLALKRVGDIMSNFGAHSKEMISIDDIQQIILSLPYSYDPKYMSAWQIIPSISVKSQFTQQKKILVHFDISYSIFHISWCWYDMEPRFPFYPRLLGLNSLCTTKDCLTNKQKNKERGAPDFQAIHLSEDCCIFHVNAYKEVVPQHLCLKFKFQAWLQTQFREGCKKKKARFHSLLLWRGPDPPPPS